jgi:hypothetical protein
MLIFHPQIAGQIRDINIGNKTFENVVKLKYLGRTVTNKI